jgi:hypothetical protein
MNSAREGGKHLAKNRSEGEELWRRGYLVVLRYASLHETSMQWDKLTLKKGSMAGGWGRKK